MNRLLASNLANSTDQEIYDAVYTDHLTQAHNRRAFDQLYTGGPVAIFDLDSLKYINDTMGHRAGDAFIQYASCCLIQQFGFDNVFRTGGDEFLVINYQEGQIDKLCDYLPFLTAGFGPNLTCADGHLNMLKECRELDGDRAPRGCRPTWFNRLKEWGVL